MSRPYSPGDFVRDALTIDKLEDKARSKAALVLEPEVRKFVLKKGVKEPDLSKFVHGMVDRFIRNFELDANSKEEFFKKLEDSYAIEVELKATLLELERRGQLKS